MHHPTDRITHTTAFVSPVVEHWLEREIAQWVNLFQYTFVLFFEMNILLFKQFCISCSFVLSFFNVNVHISFTLHSAIFRSSQCSTTGVTKAVVCVILSVGWCI